MSFRAATKKKSSTKRRPIRIDLTERQIREIQQAFHLFDTNGEGVMELKELNVALRSLGLELEKQELKQLITEADKDQSGKIDFVEFLAIIRKMVGYKMSKEDTSAVFDKFDIDKTGEISVDNLVEVSKNLGEDMTREELKEMLDMMKGSGKATKDAFLQYMKRTGVY